MSKGCSSTTRGTAFLLYSYKMNGVCFINYFSVCSSGQFTKYNNSVARVSAVYNQRK